MVDFPTTACYTKIIMFKKYIQRKLENYVRRYFIKHPEVKLVVVAGSIGKTSAKIMTATILSQKLRVRMDNSNHNTHMSAPLGILGITYPDNIYNPFAWLAVFAAARKRISQPSDVDVIVQELGTDRIGEIPHFGTYLSPDIAVITAVTAEHMEFFGTIEAVAQEELAAANFSKLALINRDDIDGRFAEFITDSRIVTYGTTGTAEYRFEISDWSLADGFVGSIIAPELAEPLAVNISLIGEHSLHPVMGAVTVALKCGLSVEEIKRGVELIEPVPGRMNVLRGLKDSVLIDDSYNSSPAAAASALQTLYTLTAPQRIAVLGSMNELGEVSAQEHETLGDMCDPSLLAWVVTVGDEANQYIAPRARAKGCQVKSFRTALEAGGFVSSVLETDGVTLFKGSQGDIYLEEAVKMVLHSAGDDSKLVRQSSTWMKTKQALFEKMSS